MREMKDSGVKTLGLIPSCWTTKKLKYVINSITTGLNPRNYFVLGDGDCFYVTIRNFRNGKILLDDNCDRITPEIKTLINKRSKLEKGNILFASISDEGRAYLIENSPDNWDINESVFSIKPQNNIDSRFLFYILTDYHFYKPLKINSTGSTFTSIKQDMLLNGTLVYPPIDEQKRIATYLDEQCRKIDEIMADIQSQFDTLENYRKSVISEAVTQGLNPNVEMKETDMGWIKQVPAKWNISRIASVYELRNEKVSDKDYQPLSVTMKGVLPQLDTVAKSDAHDDRKLVRKGDFAINSRSDRRGSCGIAPCDGSISLINTVLCPLTNMNPIYYNWLFHTTEFADEFYKWGHGIVDDLWTTGWQEMKNILIPVPPVQEQEEIAKYLNKKCADIDSIIEDKKAQFETIENYKKSLIYEYVTGKKEVPENE